MGTITGIGDLDPVRWPNSHWRSVKVCHCRIIGIFLDVRTTLCVCFLRHVSVQVHYLFLLFSSRLHACFQIPNLFILQ